MPGRATAATSGSQLQAAVEELGRRLGLEVRSQVRVGRRLWGAERCIDVVLTRSDAGKSLGIECKYQGGPGTAEEKVPATVQDIQAWPIAGIVVVAGAGFSSNMRSFLHSTGRAVEFEDLEAWVGAPVLRTARLTTSTV